MIAAAAKQCRVSAQLYHRSRLGSSIPARFTTGTSDQLLFVCAANKRQAQLFINQLNNIHPRIIFQLEMETDMTFLTSPYKESKMNHVCVIEVYRKPTLNNASRPNYWILSFSKQPRKL